MKIKGAFFLFFCNTKQERPSSGHGFKKKKKKSDRGIFFTSPKQYCNNWSLQGTLTSKETKMMKVFSLLLDILMLLDGGTKIIFAI